MYYVSIHSLERDQYQLSSLSHTINNKAIGYYELPVWPVHPPPSHVRNIEVPKPMSTTTASKSAKAKVCLVTICYSLL